MEYHNNKEEFTDLQLERIIECRNRLSEMMISPIEKIDEDLLNEIVIRFLRFKDYDVEAALEIGIKSMKLGLADEIVKIPYEEWKRVFDYQIFVALKKRAADGSKIVWIRARNWNVKELDLVTLMAGVYYYLDESLYSVKNQKNGVSLIIDMSGLGVVMVAKILSFFTIDIMHQVASFFQGTYPLRIKAIHFIHSPLILVSFFAGVKYLITKKMRERLHLHYRGPQVLLKHFDKKALPVSLNGCIPDEDALDVKTVKIVNKKGLSGAANTLTLRKNFVIPN